MLVIISVKKDSESCEESNRADVKFGNASSWATAQRTPNLNVFTAASGWAQPSAEQGKRKEEELVLPGMMGKMVMNGDIQPRTITPTD